MQQVHEVVCSRHYICQIGDLLFSSIPGKRFVAMFYAYLDEGGHPSDSKVVSVAGVVSSIPQWHTFDEQWRKTLAWYDIPGFHMTDFESRQGIFRTWERRDPRAIPLIAQLTDIFITNIQFGCVFSLIMEDWNTLMRDRFPDLFERKRAPLVVLLQTCLEAIDLKIPNNQPVACMFEETKFLSGAAPAHFSSWKKAWGLNERFKGALAFGGKYEHPPLQAADILAYEGAKHVLNVDVEGGKIPERRLHARLRQSQKIRAEYFNAEGLLAWLEDYTKRDSLFVNPLEN